MTRSKTEKDANGNTSNEKCTNKKNILNYNDDIISAPSTTIAIKKEQLYLPNPISMSTKEKNIYIYHLHELYK